MVRTRNEVWLWIFGTVHDYTNRAIPTKTSKELGLVSYIKILKSRKHSLFTGKISNYSATILADSPNSKVSGIKGMNMTM